MPYHRPMDNNNCCWNRMHGYQDHNNDCLLAYGPQYRNATMAVTFMDGQTLIYKNVRVCINTPKVDDGITANGTTLSFEVEAGTGFTLLGVRQYVYTIDEDQD